MTFSTWSAVVSSRASSRSSLTIVGPACATVISDAGAGLPSDPATDPNVPNAIAAIATAAAGQASRATVEVVFPFGEGEVGSATTFEPASNRAYSRSKVQVVTYTPAPSILALGDGYWDVVRPAKFPEQVLRWRNDRAAAEVGLEALDPAAWERHFAAFSPLEQNLPEPRIRGGQILPDFDIRMQR